MRNYYYLLACAFLALGLYSCSGNEKKETAEETIAQEEAPKMVDAVSIWEGISVRKEPSSDGKWISSISLGEKVLIVLPPKHRTGNWFSLVEFFSFRPPS
jgi:hypothetical protein